MPDYGAAAPDANIELKSLFRLEIDNVPSMAFEGLTVGEASWAEIEQRTGIDDLVRTKGSGLRDAETLKITKRLRVGGQADVIPILNWYMKGSTDRRNGSVIITNRETADILRINFKEAWVQSRGELDFNATEEGGTVDFTFTLRLKTFEFEAV